MVFEFLTEVEFVGLLNESQTSTTEITTHKSPIRRTYLRKLVDIGIQLIRMIPVVRRALVLGRFVLLLNSVKSRVVFSIVVLSVPTEKRPPQNNIPK